MTDTTQIWETWVDARIKASEAALSGAVADVIGGIQKQNQAAFDALRAEAAALKSEVSELRAEARLRGSLDDVQARLAKLETPPRLRPLAKVAIATSISAVNARKLKIHPTIVVTKMKRAQSD